jgi:formylglycine-generating enzyme required for sulfatase activity
MAIPSDQFPSRLANLGFTAKVSKRGIFASAQLVAILPPLCTIPAGAFLMGSDPTKDTRAKGDELPQHPVTLPAYQIARFPVTVAEYACFVRAGLPPPAAHLRLSEPRDWEQQLGTLDHPVVRVAWTNAVAYTI